MARKRRIEYAYELAQLNIERTRQELSQVPDFDSRLISSLVPELPNIDFVSELPLYPTESNPNGIFASRADYERTLRYLDRINRAASSSYGSGLTPSGVEQTMLTSFTINENNGDVIQSEFMRRESQYAVQRENKRRLQALRDAGVEMTKTPVYRLNEETGELSQVYTDSGHPLYQWVPATPEAQRRYWYAAKQNAQISMIQPEIPEDAVVVMWGDVVPAQRSHERVFTPKEIATRTQQDKAEYTRSMGYFANLQAVLDDVMPSAISDKFDPIFDQILQEPLEVQRDIYNLLEGRGRYADEDTYPLAEIMDFDYFYRSITTSAATKLTQLYSLFRDRVIPKLSKHIDMDEVYSAEEFEAMFEGESEVMREGQNIFERYQFLKQQGKTHGVSLAQFVNVRKGK